MHASMCVCVCIIMLFQSAKNKNKNARTTTTPFHISGICCPHKGNPQTHLCWRTRPDCPEFVYICTYLLYYACMTLYV